MEIIWIIIWIIVVLLFYYLLKSSKGEFKRKPIPESIKKEVWEHYYQKCAVCNEDRLTDISWHHRKEVCNGGDNSKENIVPLCSYHHNLITRNPKNGKEK